MTATPRHAAGWTARRTRRRALRALAAAGALLATLLLAGCTGNESYPNNPKAPAVLNVTVLIGENQIAASPKSFGAGPTRFVITNQTGVKQQVTLSTDQFDRSVSIDPSQTTNFKQTVEPGIASIDADKTAADSFELKIGPKRPSAQQDLDQP